MSTALRRVLGVDPGSIRCGWGVVEARGTRLVRIASGAIIAGRGELPERLATIYAGLRAVASEHLPNEAAIEALFYHKNPQSALKLGEARGVAILALHDAGLRMSEYEATVVKKAVVGSGGAKKEQVAMMMSAMLGFVHKGPLDETDALAVAVCHLNRNPLLMRTTL